MDKSIYYKAKYTVKDLLVVFYLFTSLLSLISFKFISNYLDLLFSLLMLGLMLYFFFTKEKKIFIYITMPILLIDCSFHEISVYINSFKNGIFNTASLYQFFGFACLMQIFILDPLTKNKIYLNKNFILIFLLSIIAIISVAQGYFENTIRLFQSLFYVQNIAIVYFIYRWISKWQLQELYILIKVFFYTIIIIQFFYFFVENEYVNSAKYFYYGLAFPLIIYVLKTKNSLIVKFSAITILLVFLINQNVLSSSITVLMILITSVIATLFYFFSDRLYNFFNISLIYMFILGNSTILLLTLFPDWVISNFQLIYDARGPLTSGFYDTIQFKFFGDRSPIWMGVLYNLSENSLLSNLIKYSGGEAIPLAHGTFNVGEFLYSWNGGAHQLTLEIIMNLGILGCLVYLLVFYDFLGNITKHAQSKNFKLTIFTLQTSTLSYLILPSFVSTTVLATYSFIFWFSLGIVIALMKSKITYGK